MKDVRFLLSMKSSAYKLLKIISVEQEKSMTFILNQAFREFAIKHYKNFPRIVIDGEEKKE